MRIRLLPLPLPEPRRFGRPRPGATEGGAEGATRASAGRPQKSTASGVRPLRRVRLRSALAALLVGAIAASACGPDAASRLAGRILDDYRRKAGVRPLPSAGLVRARLGPLGKAGAGGGTLLVEWEHRLFRETVSSGGVEVVRGTQGGKAFETDEDGVTRVGSEPLLAELVTRSYFWRRAYLFDDREGARVSLGPADSRTISVRLRPKGGNDLLLVFDRDGGTLRSAASPRLRLEFEDARRYRDLSRPERPVAGEITWSDLPTRRIPDAEVGGWRGRFEGPSSEAALGGSPGAVLVPVRVSSVSGTLLLDANADGPPRISADLAKRAGLAGTADVFGRVLAPGAALQIGTFVLPGVHVEIAAKSDPRADAVAGGTFFRETVVEIDPSASRLRLHDPARWAPPGGFERVVLDDDGNRPVATLLRSGRRLRLRAGVPSDVPLLLAPPIARELGIGSPAGELSGLVWGSLRLPPLPAKAAPGFDAEWGDDGAVGAPLLLRFHVFLDMPHRWIYLRPVETGGASPQGQSDR